jgi:hypothetical protein
MHAYVGPPFNRPLVHWNHHGCVPAMTSPHRQTHVLAGAHPFIGSFTSNVHLTGKLTSWQGRIRL